MHRTNQLVGTDWFETSAAAGLLFGFALEKGQVFSPQTVVGQMLMKDFTMLKVA